WLIDDDCNINDLSDHTNLETAAEDYPWADRVEQKVLLYAGPELAAQGDDPEARRAIQAELARALRSGPGIFVLKHAFDSGVIDAATSAFNELLAQQKAAGADSGDHFAKPGANDRLWRAQQKLASHAPEIYTRYYANPLLALASAAWLGPMYQVTSDLNIVNPGGQAQNPHRD